ncbi:acyltransferase family protein [Rhodococcus pyridinivorans]|uniref:acyltransferase family protein n=1 Tax=Rhodococcus pyridinivorans TaxID=103816 RepID=UPI000761DAFC
MRALAILSVLIYHAGAPFLPGGYVGVDVFFVISGFLITSHLLGEVQRSGKVRLAAFYARRIRRLLLASLFVLVSTLVFARLFLPPLAMEEVSRDGIFTATYLANVWFAYTGTDYLANEVPSVFQTLLVPSP